MHSSLLEPEVSPHLFLELPKAKVRGIYNLASFVILCSSLHGNSLLSLNSDLSIPDSRGYRKVNMIDFQPIHLERDSWVKTEEEKQGRGAEEEKEGKGMTGRKRVRRDGVMYF